MSKKKGKSDAPKETRKFVKKVTAECTGEKVVLTVEFDDGQKLTQTWVATDTGSKTLEKAVEDRFPAHISRYFEDFYYAFQSLEGAANDTREQIKQIEEGWDDAMFCLRDED